MQPPTHETTNRTTSVIVVDDDEFVRLFLTRALTQAGYTCDAVSDGKQGLDALLRKTADVALIDLDMPVMNGLQLLAALGERSLDVVPVVLTGRADVSRAVECMKLGAFDLIEKPCDPEALNHTIEKAVRQKRLLDHADRMTRLAERWETLFDASPDLIILLDPEFRVLQCNVATADLLGVTKRELEGQLCHDVVCRDHHKADECPFQRLSRGSDAPSHEFTLGDRLFDLRVTVLTDEEDGTWGTLNLARDTSQRRLLEMQLHQAQKLESIGQLAAGIAHEINTPMQYVGDNTQFLRKATGALVAFHQRACEMIARHSHGEAGARLVQEFEEVAKSARIDFLAREIPRAIEQSLEGISRVSQIVRSMKEFSHPGLEEKTPTDLNHAIENTVTVARNEWKYVAELETALDLSLPLVPLLIGDFNQVILNLIINSAHAIADVIGDASQEKGLINISTQQDGDSVVIRVSDTGGGIPEKVRGQIFDPFFTTKAVGKGTGQGLAIAHAAIVKRHGGTITFDTEMGRGTTFVIRLPLNGEAASEQEQEA